MPIINFWFGRLGNNIQQLSNAIFYSQNNNVNFSSPMHPFIKCFSIINGKEDDFSSRFFFYNGSQKDFECDEELLNKARRDICLKYITPNLNISFEKPFSDDTLVIHLRSGDVFISNPPSTYTQNPLSFYKKIIKNFKKIIIVSEDNKHPLLQELLKEENVSYQSSSISDDFSTLIRAKHLATSGVGTFSIAAALCSINLKKLYCSDIFCNEHLNPTMLLNSDIEVEMYNISNYIKIGDWKNTVEQRKIMLEHEIKYVNTL